MGREVVEKLTGKTVLDSMDGFFTRYGNHTILVCRLLPFVPFDPISYAAGLTSIRFRSFFIATGLGQLPATIVYSPGGQHVNRRYLLVCHRTVYSVCPDRGDFYGEENMA